MELLDRIFYAGLEEFRDYGIKFTMDGLAARLHISKRTLYETVPSKAKVIELVIDRTFMAIKEQQRVVLENEALSTKDKIYKLLTIRPAYSDLVDYRQVVEIGKTYPEQYRMVQERIETDWEPTIRLLEKGIEEGVIKPYNITIIKEMFIIAFERLLDGRFLIKNGITYEQALEQVTSILFEGITV